MQLPEPGRPEKVSIVNLFQKMHSNVTKFQQSRGSSPSASQATLPRPSDGRCSCLEDSKQRQIESELYRNQHDLVSRAAGLLQAEGNDPLSKLLSFMSEYLCRLGEECEKELLCRCRRQKAEQNQELQLKIAFLRDENHKFFRMIEEKSQECEQLRQEIEALVQGKTQRLSSREETDPLPITLRSRNSSVASSSVSQELSSRTIASNSSRVSEFRVVWPELIMPMGEGAHKGYFQPSPGDRQAPRSQPQCLKEKEMNYPSENGSRKPRLFCCGNSHIKQ